MTDFGYLNELHVDGGDVAELTLMSVQLPNGKNPVLIGKPATEANKPYTLAVARKTIKQQKGARGATVSPEMAVSVAKRNRDDDRELYAEHVITGWRDVCDGDGKDVKFTKDVCLAFLKMLPDDIFDQLRQFFPDSANFRDAVSDDEARAEGNG